nr:hypothetical protein [Leptospiraceae bacterium]
MKDRIIQNLEIFKDGENRKAFFRNNWKGLVFAVIAVIGAIYAAKHFTKKKEEPNAKMKRPEDIDGGKKIKFVPGSIGLDRI